MPSRQVTNRTALITGIAGQDGSYLADLLVGKGYRVIGVVRDSAKPAARLAHLAAQVELVEADLLDATHLADTIREYRPHEIYNLAGHSFVPSSWERSDLLAEVTGIAASRLLEAIRATDPTIRFYQASSSEMFGNAAESPQNEATPLNPRNPYGAAKAFAHFSTVNAREGMGLFAVSGILYNHESPRRGVEFVTRKVTDGAARISMGMADSISMGSLEAVRDWGFAGDYVRAMWLMLQQHEPRDYVIASGVGHSVRDLCQSAFAHVGLDYERHVLVDPNFVRPPEAVPLLGDPTRARRELGWAPEVSFEQMIGLMVEHDLALHRTVPKGSQRI